MVQADIKAINRQHARLERMRRHRRKRRGRRDRNNQVGKRESVQWHRLPLQSIFDE